MKNSKLVKLVLIMIVGLLLTSFANYTLAVTNEDMTGTLTGNSTTGNTITLTGNDIISGTTNNTTNTTTNNSVLTTNNTSNYNNSSLPKTGIGDSVPSMIFVVVLVISAVYAYKKMQDYKNI